MYTILYNKYTMQSRQRKTHIPSFQHAKHKLTLPLLKESIDPGLSGSGSIGSQPDELSICSKLACDLAISCGLQFLSQEKNRKTAGVWQLKSSPPRNRETSWILLLDTPKACFKTAFPPQTKVKTPLFSSLFIFLGRTHIVGETSHFIVHWNGFNGVAPIGNPQILYDI